MTNDEKDAKSEESPRLQIALKVAPKEKKRFLPFYERYKGSIGKGAPARVLFLMGLRLAEKLERLDLSVLDPDHADQHERDQGQDRRAAPPRGKARAATK